MKTINKIVLILLFSSLTNIIVGQTIVIDTTPKPRTNLNESVIITAQFDPIVNEAMKLSENPTIFDTSFTMPSFEYQILNKVFPTRMNINQIKPAKVKGEPIAMLYNGNIKAGIGTYLTPYVEALYAETRNKTLLYSVNARHYSSHWSIKDYPKNHFANNDINLYAKKIWDKFFIDAKAYYNNSIDYYYGFNNDTIGLKAKDYRTIWHNVGFKTTYSNINKNENSLDHKVALGVENLSSKWKSNELNVFVLADVNKKFELFGKDKQILGISINYQHSFFKYDLNNLYQAPYFLYSAYPMLGFDTSNLSIDANYNTAILDIKPYFDFKINRFQLHTALSFAPEFGENKSFKILPTAIVYFPIVPKKLYFNGGLEGSIDRVKLNALRMENPYISPFIQIKPTTQLNLFASLNSKIKDLEISLEGGIINYKNHHFYLFDNLSIYKNMFNIVYDDAVKFYVKGHVEYNISALLSLVLDAQYQTYKTDKLAFAYYQPDFLTNLTLQYIAAKKLIIDLKAGFKTTSKAIYMNEEKTLGAIVDINLGVEYLYSKQLSFFLRLNNLAFQRYQEYYNYPSQKFMGMIGASFSF